MNFLILLIIYIVLFIVYILYKWEDFSIKGPLQDNVYMSWMGWTKAFCILIAFPALAYSDVNGVVNTMNLPTTSELITHSGDFVCSKYTLAANETDTCAGKTRYIRNFVEATIYTTSTVTDTVTTTDTVTATVTVTDTKSSVPTEGTNKKESICNWNHFGWGGAYALFSFINLLACDKIDLDRRFISHMLCDGISSSGVAYSGSSISNIFGSCKDAHAMDLVKVHSTSFVGIGTAFAFKMYGCTKVCSRAESLLTCNEFANNALSYFVSLEAGLFYV